MNTSPEPREPTPFSDAAASLNTISDAVRTAQSQQPATPETGADQALDALVHLRELREQLAGWEPGLIEAARAAGSSWADLAHPLGVSSRQAAERRYLRVRPGAPDTTGEQRVQATRNSRAADRTITTWARANAAELRQLAGQITALTDLPAQSRTALARLAEALADNDAANLLAPLTDTHRHIKDHHPDLATRIAAITDHADHIRNPGNGHG
ncbi:MULTISPECIES: type III effector protein [unclassified Streptomyces]|uniref:type III effector protein n=1 Tax=unclassified Streptomyces TaxID=2593676 RepID=UPI0038090AD3